jgi:heptosyltransferase-2
VGILDKYFGNIGLKLLKGFVLEKNLDPAEIDQNSIHNILVVLRHQMGDMLAATPMLRSLKSFYPAAKLILITKDSTRYEEIFSGGNSIADEVYKYEHGFENFVNLIKDLRIKKPDLAVIPSTVVFSSTNHLFAYYSYAKIRAGVKSMDFEENRVSYLLNVKKDFKWSIKKVHQIERNLEIIRQLNITPAQTKIKINLSKEIKDYAERFFQENSIDISKPVIGFHPGAGKKENVWPAEKFAELAYLLNKQFGAQILISEGPDDKNYVQDMTKILKEKYGLGRFIRHKGLLMRNLALLNLCRLFVSNDTGIMHLASGLTVPVVGLFGPSKAYEWGPLGENKVSVQSASSKITDINVESVFEQCQKLLG